MSQSLWVLGWGLVLAGRTRWAAFVLLVEGVLCRQAVGVVTPNNAGVCRYSANEGRLLYEPSWLRGGTDNSLAMRSLRSCEEGGSTT